MVESEEDFGDFDEEAMQGVCTQAEASFQGQDSKSECIDNRAVKRRRIQGTEVASANNRSPRHGIYGTEDFMSQLSSEDEVVDSRNRNTAPAWWNQHPPQYPPQHIKSSTVKLNKSIELGVTMEQANLSTNAFSSPPSRNRREVVEISSQNDQGCQHSDRDVLQPLRGQQANLRQTTLFGGQAAEMGPRLQSRTQTNSKIQYNYPLLSRQEPPTHHMLNYDNLKTWVYPTNLGSIRDYQYSIVSGGLFNNLLVALPTGLGKTFIAATVMLNWYRWTTNSQIIFVAPTKPLVAQQIDACFNIVGIPRSDTSMLNGEVPVGTRAQEWNEKRVFFLTPQTCLNDIRNGLADPARIVLVVVDEAHRATGSYAYVEMIKAIKQHNSSFRILALTATPGSSVESVQEVIDGLHIARTEIRTEDSMDIRNYVQPRSIETTIFQNTDEMALVMGLFSSTLRPLINKVRSQNAYINADPMALSAYMCNQLRLQWLNSNAGRQAPQSVKNMVNTIFAILSSLGHAIELLKFHGIGPFYRKVAAFRAENEGTKSSYKQQVLKDESFKKMMSHIKAWVEKSDFVGHPKLEFLCQIVMNHFLDARGTKDNDTSNNSSSTTRIMVFAHYRDSAEEIVRVLERNSPIVRPHVFVGQASSSESDGMGQKRQQEVIGNFKSGNFNTLVATSIGEEGLDIGEVDLIICYDASASPIRMLQRMGRTGRKRAGKIEILLMEGKEEEKFRQAKDNYEKMQQMINEGSRFKYHTENSPRIVPRDVQPEVVKMIIEIPPENSQTELPVPKRKGRAPKRPPRRWNLPKGVRTGFTTASRIRDGVCTSEEPAVNTPPAYESVIPVESVFLSKEQEELLERNYLKICGPEAQMVEPPNMKAFTSLQRKFRPTRCVEHGRAASKLVSMMRALHELANADDDDERFIENLSNIDSKEIDTYLLLRKRRAFDYSEDENAIGSDTSSILPSRKCDANNDFNAYNETDPLNDFIENGESPGYCKTDNFSPSTAAIFDNGADAGRVTSDDDLPSMDELIGKNKTHVSQNPRRRLRIIDTDDED